jgi:chromosome segregation ATPase
MAEKDIIVNLKVNTGDSTQSVNELAKSEKDLAINTEAANVALKQSTAVTTQNANATEQAADANVSLKKQLRDLQAQLAKLAVAGKQNTKEYKNLRNEAGQLKDAISDVSQEIAQAGSDTKGLDQTIRVASVAAAGFSILEGATALFGKENEDLQKSLLKVTAAVSVLNGLQEIQA